MENLFHLQADHSNCWGYHAWRYLHNMYVICMKYSKCMRSYYDLIHLLYFIMPALSFDSIDQENFFIKQLNLDSIPCVFSVMCFCCVLSRVKLTPPSTSWGCQRVIYFSYPRLTFGIKRWKLLCIMKHFSQSLGSSRAQVLQNTVIAWHHDTSDSSNGLPVFHPKILSLGWRTWQW